VSAKPISTWLLRYCVSVAARTPCGVNSASTDLPRHLGVLREKLQHPTDYEKAVFYFLEEFAGDAGFVTPCVPREASHLIAILQHVAKTALGETAQLAPGRTFYVPEHGFYHGNALLAGRIALFFYFEQADVGAVAFMTLGSGENQIARFQIKDALLGGNPTKN